MDNDTLPLEQALTIHKPATDYAFALQHLGTKPSSLVDLKKGTRIAALARIHPDCFSIDTPPLFEHMETDDVNSYYDLAEV